MKSTLIKTIACSLTIMGTLTLVPQKTMATTDKSPLDYLTRDNCHSSKHNKDKWIFDDDNQKYLSKDQKKKLEEIKKTKEKCGTLSDEQKKDLNEIREIIIKNKLGDEKYKDFKCLIEKKKSNNKLTSEEEKKLKEYKKILKLDDDCDNHTTFKEFLR